jgi:signal transduction histidine kinase
MSFKSRFALLFSVSVFIILTLSALYVFILNEDFRQREFFTRVKDEAFQSSRLYAKFGYNIAAAENELEANTVNSLPEETIVFYDSSFRQLHVSPKGKQPVVRASYLKLAKEHGLYTYIDDGNETAIIYSPAPVAHFVVASAYDKYGRSKANNLKIILIFSVLGGLGISAFLAFIYVKQVIKPLNNLKQQMQRINEQNLTERLVVENQDDELTNIAKNFNDMLDRLEHAFETRKNFVQHASHELRTPLANMLSQTEAALGKNLTVEEYKQIFQSLKEDQQDMISLTNSLLLLSQYESLTYVDDWKIIRIDELLYETIDITKTVFRESIVTVHFEEVPDDEEQLMFKGNELLIKSAIQNLIRNACKYSDDGHVNITIQAMPAVVRLVFDNTGKQILPEEQPKLFIPFFRGENSVNKKGFGLGLSIVQRILLLHKASVKYQAIAPNQNRFIVELPHN